NTSSQLPSLHDALPILDPGPVSPGEEPALRFLPADALQGRHAGQELLDALAGEGHHQDQVAGGRLAADDGAFAPDRVVHPVAHLDRKSTRLNSSHVKSS